MLSRSAPIFAVRDVVEAVAFYRDVLGFRRDWLWGRPPTFGGCALDAVSVMFSQQPDIARHVRGHEHHFWSDDVDARHARHAAAGAEILAPPENKPWGVREYTVVDPNGYHLRFTGHPAHEKPAGALAVLPDFIRIDCRMPTLDEYAALHRAVGWKDDPGDGAILASSFAGVVALDTRDGTAVGCARAMRDGRAWFSIWDVIVRPDSQNRRVGSALVAALLAGLRRTAPAGSNVNLFTYKPDFYAKLGFDHEPSYMLRLD